MVAKPGGALGAPRCGPTPSLGVVGGLPARARPHRHHAAVALLIRLATTTAVRARAWQDFRGVQLEVMWIGGWSFGLCVCCRCNPSMPLPNKCSRYCAHVRVTCTIGSWAVLWGCHGLVAIGRTNDAPACRGTVIHGVARTGGLQHGGASDMDR